MSWEARPMSWEGGFVSREASRRKRQRGLFVSAVSAPWWLDLSSFSDSYGQPFGAESAKVVTTHVSMAVASASQLICSL